jgi:hypothetical protein
MRNSNKKFSDNYKLSLKISSSLGTDKGIEEHLVRWSSDIVDTLADFFKNDKNHFKVVISIDPNPSNFKGCDSVKVEIWQTGVEGDKFFKPFIKFMSESKMTLGECIEDVNEKLDILTYKKVPEIIELHGKKYYLTEVEE